MLVPVSEFSGSEPETDKCRTEEIITDLFRCSGNNRICKYGLPAGTTSTYCLHPEFRKFHAALHDGSRMAAANEISKQSA